MTKDEKITALAHLVIGVAVQLIVAGLFRLVTGSWAVGAWAGAGCAMALFYGREHDQEEHKAAERAGVPRVELWEELSVAVPCLWPPSWSAGNRWDFYAPALATVILAMAVTIGGAL